MRQDKIIWIISQYASTPETGLGGRHYYFAQELAKLGYKVYVIAASHTHILKNPKSFEGDFLIENIQPNFDFVWLKVPKYKNSGDKQRILNWFIFSWKLLKLEKILSIKPDVILYSSLSLIGYLSAEKLAKKYQIPLVFEVRDIWPLTLIEIGGYSPSHPFIKLLQLIEDRAYKNSNKVISNLKNAVEHMVEHGLQESKFTWIPNGYSAQEIAERKSLPQDIIDLIPKNKFIIGYTGSIGIVNCLDNLIEAACTLRHHTELYFVIVGRGEFLKKLEQYVAKFHLTNVVFIPPITKKQVPSMLSLFDVCYLGWKKNALYRFGISPNKMCEYLYAKKPILHAFTGYIDPITEAQAGITVEAENSKEIANGILKLYSLSQIEREKMGQNGYEYVLQNYEYGHLAHKLEKVLFD